MGRNKRKKGYKLSYWCTCADNCEENLFAQIGVSLLQHPSFLGLQASAQHTYICMVIEAKGKPEFEFPRNIAKKYGIAGRTLVDNVKRLRELGFIEVIASGKSTREPSQYRFSIAWKSVPEKG